MATKNEKIVIIKAKIADFTKKMDKASSKMAALSKKTTEVGKSLTTKLSVPIVAIGALSGKMAIDFEDGMAKVGTIADTTVTSIDGLKDGIMDLSSETGQGATALTDSLYQAISAGVDTADSVAFLGDSVKLAEGGFTDTTTAVDTLSTILNTYGLAAEDASKISDQLIMTQNLGKTTVGELGASLGNVIPIASAAGVSTEALFASLATLTKNGIGTAQAVTGMKAALSNVIKPSSEAAKMAEKLGLNFSSAHLESVGWAQFLDEVKDKTGGNTEKMAQLFGSVEALNSVMVLAGGGSEDFADALQQMEGAAGATDEAFEKVSDTTGHKMKESFNKVKNAGIQLGTALTPVIEKLAEIISSLAEKFNGLSDEQMDMVIKVGMVVAAIGPLLAILGTITTVVSGVLGVIGTISGAIGLLTGALTVATPAATGLAAVITALTGPIGLAIAAIAAIIAIGVTLYKNWDVIKEKAAELGSFLSGKWDDIKEATSKKWNEIKGGISNKWNEIKTNTGNKINEMKTNVSNGWNSIKSKTGVIWGAIKAKVAENGGGIKGILKTSMQSYKNIWGAGFNLLDQLTGGKLNNVVNTVKDKLAIIKNFFSSLKLKIPKPSLPKLPSFSLRTSSKTIFGKTIKYPSGLNINWHAEGGIFTQPTVLGNHGFGDVKGGEAILPLERLYAELRKIIRTENQNNQAIFYLDGREFARATSGHMSEALNGRIVDKNLVTGGAY